MSRPRDSAGGAVANRRAGMEQINLKSSAIDKYSYLSNLRNTNAGLFYRLLIDHMKVRALWRATLGLPSRGGAD